MSFPSSFSGPSRLSGLVTCILSVALLGSAPSGWPLPSPMEGIPVGGAVAGTARQPEAEWLWPVAQPHPVLRPFEAPETHYSAGHRGIDIGAVSGDSVIAPADGIVHFAGTVVDRPVVSIRLPDGLIVSMEPVAAVGEETAGVAVAGEGAALEEGSAVERGQEIGRVGTGGHCTAECLHLGVRLHGEYVSPMRYLGGIPLSVLLPTRPIG